MTGGQDRLRNDLLNGLLLLPAFTSKLVENRIEGVLQKHIAQIETTTTELLTGQNARLDPLIRRSPKVSYFHKCGLRTQNHGRARTLSPKPKALRSTVSQYASACPTTCVCSCHTQVKAPAPAPAFVNRVLGQLFVGTAGVPFLNVGDLD